jgi:cellulose synthase/poly-beta-1,6-N-acetylglucosamine synthase-like glycosyltransferase
MKTVSVILNGYKRNHTLREQVEAVENQTHKVDTIMYWQNTSQLRYDLSPLVDKGHDIAVSTKNYGVWARFAYALNAKTDYVCVIDDDTIPGDRWIENCVNTYETHPGLLGTIGLIFENSNGYNVLGENRFGWDNNNTEVKKVDIVGHNWFFHRDLLSVFWRELPSVDESFLVGEDIHFSHMIQKYTDMGTWVPPHPPEDRRLWGSLKAIQYGGDANATANFAVPMMGEYLKRCVSEGFKLIK